MDMHDGIKIKLFAFYCVCVCIMMTPCSTEHRTVKLAKNVAKVKDQVATRGKVHPEEDKPPQKKRMKPVRHLLSTDGTDY